MKFTNAMIASAIIALFAVACHAELKDDSTVDDECPGCHSRLSLKISGTGFGDTADIARNQCSEKCDISVEERQKICARLCGVQFPKFEAFGMASPSPQFCSLCGGNVGQGVNDCRAIINSLVNSCKNSCRSNPDGSPSTPFPVPGPGYTTNYLIFSTKGVTQPFPAGPGSCV